MSGMGETLADLIRGLYIIVGTLAFIVVALLGVIAWLVFR